MTSGKLVGRGGMALHNLWCRTCGRSRRSKWRPTAAAVRGPKHVVTKGAASVLKPAEMRALLDRIDTSDGWSGCGTGRS